MSNTFSLEEQYVQELIKKLKSNIQISETEIVDYCDYNDLDIDKIVNLLIQNNMLLPESEAEDEETFVANLYW